MPIQKALISDDRAGEEHATDESDNDLGYRTHRKMFEYLRLAYRRRVSQGSPHELMRLRPN